MGVHHIPVKDSEGNTVSTYYPFATKIYGLKKLFKRVHGVQQACVQGENIIDFIVPYNAAKIARIEFLYGEALDKCSFEVYDTPTGTISGVPNYKLNQFGFNVNVSKDYYIFKSEYDADLIKDLKLRLIYNSQSAKTIGVNIDLNEVK